MFEFARASVHISLYLCSPPCSAGVRALEFEGEYDEAMGFVSTDPLRLTVSFDGGLGGFEADEILIEGT